MTNTNTASVIYNLRRGDVFVGRHAHTAGKVLRIEGAEGPWFLVRHRGNKHVNLAKTLPTTLFASWEAVGEEDGAALYPWNGDRSVISVSSADAPTPRARVSKKRDGTKPAAKRAKLEPVTGNVSVMPEKPSPQSFVMAQPSNDAPASPGVEKTNVPVRVPHFGPEPLPAVANRVVETKSGSLLRLYTSNRDGSEWVVVRDLARHLGVNQDKFVERAANKGGEHVVKANVRIGYRNRALPTWLARVGAVGTWMRPVDGDAEFIESHRADQPEQEPPPAPSQSTDDDADGEVPDGVAIVRVDGVSLVAPGSGETDHKIRDVDLARFIGADGIRQFRARIKRYENKGDLNNLDWRPCDGRQSTGNGGVRVFEVKSAFLTMDQALFVVAKSDSPSANLLTRHIIGVFLKVQRQGGAVAAPVPAIDQMMTTMAQIAARAASEAARETVGAMLAEFRKGQPAAAPVDEKVQQDAETLRQQRANAARKGAETRDFNEMFRNVRDVLAPLAHRFATERLVRADTRNHAELGRCLRPSEMRTMFESFIKANDKRIPAEEREALDTLDSVPGTGFRDRAFYCLFNEMSANVKVQRTIDEDGEQVTVSALPWYPKVALAADPRQTKIPGTGH